MKRFAIYMLCLLLTGHLLSCQKIKSLTPLNPVVGEWQMGGWQIYHLPSWYVAAVPLRKSDYIITPTDTIFGDFMAVNQGVHSFTLSADHTLREQYYTSDFSIPYSIQQIVHVDTGRWSLTADTIVNFQIANRLFHQINLITDMLRMNWS